MLFKLVELIKKTDNLLLPHKGIVVDNNDPKKLNRVRCIIKGLLETDIYSNLPWCHPVISNGNPSGTVTHTPEINSELWIEFPMGKDSLYQPVYRGYWYSVKNGISNSSNPSHSVFGIDYPDGYGSQDSTGNYWYVNKKQETVDIEHSSGDHITIARNGQITINGKNNININNVGELNVTNQGKINLVSNNSDIVISSTVGKIDITATTKVTVKGTAGVDVIGSLVKLAPSSTVADILQPVVNGVITGISPCILAGIPHAFGSPTVLSSF